jgi:CBS-domain-containing membrane protein
MKLLDKLAGEHAALPPKFSGKAILLAGLGGMIAISIAALMSARLDQLLVLGSFGASCVILFAYPDAPFAQPRNVIGGHFLSSLIGLLVVSQLGVGWWALGIAVGLAIAAMMFTRTVHPPAGSNPVIVWLIASQGLMSWQFLWFPTLFGAIVITVVALVYNNLTREGSYPKYWF